MSHVMFYRIWVALALLVWVSWGCGVAQQCLDQKDCQAGQQCVSGRCQQKATCPDRCSQDSDCQNTACGANNKCINGGCGDGRACPSTCNTDADCQLLACGVWRQLSCIDNKCTPKECPGQPNCNWCRGETIKDKADCFVRYKCANGADPCKTTPCDPKSNKGCQSNEECRSDQLCWPIEKCPATCTQNSDCKTSVCGPQNTCFNGVCSDGRACPSTCTQDADCQLPACGSQFKCVNGTCGQIQECPSKCSTNADCKACGPQNTCFNGVCSDGRACPSTCTQDADCELPACGSQFKCVNGACGQAKQCPSSCTKDADCQTPSCGGNIACIAKLCSPERCKENSHCSGKYNKCNVNKEQCVACLVDKDCEQGKKCDFDGNCVAK